MYRRPFAVENYFPFVYTRFIPKTFALSRDVIVKPPVNRQFLARVFGVGGMGRNSQILDSGRLLNMWQRLADWRLVTSCDNCVNTLAMSVTVDEHYSQ